MSTTIDQRVVEMRFDNKHFEQNVSTTMSTLDKLKQKLRLDGAAKGLENVNAAAKNVNMSGVGSAVDSVQAKFSAMQVVGVTALANITNSAVNAGKRIASALTIDPIKTGFQEYETQINATQTILANTKSKGTDINDVNKALKELNEYADLTIYNFTEMTRNIGTFTAAGIDLDTSVNAIQGIANLAAVSGSTSQQASTAMYQLSQALAAGTIRLMDWNSVVNAGMGGEVFQNALRETSKELGTGAEAAIKASGSFRESLRDGWLTSEVLTQTLKKFTTSGANEYVAKYTGLSKEAVAAALEEAEARYGEADAIKYASEALAEKSGKNKDEIADILNFAKTATDAATKVKTFTQLWDVLKEAAQSGWSQTWKIIVGDFEQAKELLTPLADVLTGLINKMSEWRNAILESALGKGIVNLFTGIQDNIKKVMKPAAAAVDTVKKVTDSVEDLGKIVNKVIRGDFGNGSERYDKLTKAGQNYYKIQNEVNKALGNSFRYSDKKIAKQEELLASQGKVNDAEAIAESTISSVNAETAKNIALLAAKSDEELRALGYTEEQIKSLRELQAVADKLGLPLDEFLTKLDEINGRWLMIESFKNIGKAIGDVFKTLKGAWEEIFPPKTTEEIAQGIFNVLAAFHKFTSSLRIVDEETGELTETGDKIKRTFKGIFAIVDVLTTLLGGGFKVAWKVISSILSYFDLDILAVTAAIGDAATKFREWFNSIFDVSKILDVVVPVIKKVADNVSKFFAAFKESEWLQNAADKIAKFTASIKEWWAGLKDAEDLPKYIAEGIVNFFSNLPKLIGDVATNIWKALKGAFMGLGDGENPLEGFVGKLHDGAKLAGQVVTELGKMLLEKLNKFLSKHGFKEISEDSIAGLVNGLKGGATKVWNAALELGKKVLESIKNILGIHSPSTEMEEVGTNTIDGFVLGIQNGASNIWTAISGLFSKVVTWVKGLDWGSIFAGAASAGLVVGVIKIANTFAKFAAPLEGLGDLFENVGEGAKKMLTGLGQMFKGIGKNFKASALKKQSQALLNFAIAVAVLAGSVYLLAQLKPGALWNAVGAIVALAAVIGGLTVAVGKFGPKESVELGKFSIALLGISGSLLLVAIAVKALSDLSWDDLAIAGTAILGISGIIVGLIAATKLAGPDVIQKVGTAMLGISVAMLLMVGVIKLASKLEPDVLKKGGLVVGGLAVIIAGLIAVTKLAGSNLKKLGATVVGISVAMLLMIGVMKLAGSMSAEELIKGGLVIAGFSLIIVGLIAATKLAGPNAINKVGSTILAVGVAMLLMTMVMKLAGTMDEEEFLKGGLAIAGFAVIITGLIAATRLAGGNLKGIASTLLMASVAIGIMALTVALLGMLNIEHLAKGIVAVGMLGGVLALMLMATKNAKDCKSNLIIMTVSIGVMAAAIAALSFIDGSKLAGATAALSVVMGMFALIIKAGNNVQSSMGTLIVMTVAVGVLAGVLYLLAQLPIESTLGAATSLSVLLLAVSGSLLILSGVGKFGKDALMGVLALLAMAVPMVAFVGILALMQNVENATSNALLLTGLMTAMTLLLIPLTIVGALGMTGAPYLGVLALLTMAVPMVAFVGILALMNNIQNAEANANLLISLMTAMTQILVVLAIIAPLAMMGVGAMTALTGVMLAVGALAVAIGALVQKFPALETFLDTGIPIMEKLASGLGSIIASFITGFAGEVMTIIPQLGQALSDFMTNLGPFIEGAKQIDGTVGTGIVSLAGAILALTAADLIAGISSFIQGGASLAQLGTELSAFMVNAMPFIAGATLLNEGMMAGVKALAETILILTAADVLQGLASFITGESSLASFGEQLPGLGSQLSQFAANLGTFDESKVTTVTCAANAIKALAEAADTIPNEGGWAGKLFGENSLATFGEKLPALATNLSQFATNLGTFDESTVSTVTCAANAIKAMAEAADALPNEGGWAAKIFGDNSIATFGEKLPALGTNLSQFAANLGTFDDATVATVTCAANAIKAMAQAAEGIDGQAEWAKKIFGDNSLSTFGEEMASLGTNLKDFAANLGTFTEAQVATVNAAVRAIKALAGLADADLAGAKKHLSGFGDDLPGFASDVADFCSNMPTTDSMTTAVSNLNKLLDAVEDIGNADSGVLSDFANDLSKIGKKAVDKFVEAFTSSSAKTDMKEAAKNLADQAVDGIESKEKSIKSAATTAAERAVDGVETQKDDMSSAGADLGSGLVQGINSKQTAAYNAGFALGQKAVQGEKDGQASNSPSKLTILAGKWLGEGLIVGMKKVGNSVYKAGNNLGRSATSSISSTISSIASVINSDMDSQPTIRPVLDLSEVRTGINAISGMMNPDSSIGVRAHISAISSGMNRRGQNGSNSDVVSAIDKLSKKMDNIGNTTYSINGITYDDGSNISEAMQAIVRQARIERRV